MITATEGKHPTTSPPKFDLSFAMVKKIGKKKKGKGSQNKKIKERQKMKRMKGKGERIKEK